MSLTDWKPAPILPPELFECMDTALAALGELFDPKNPEDAEPGEWGKG